MAKILNYKYGIVGDVPDKVVDEIRRSVQAWNTFVELHQKYEARREEILSANPELQEADKRLREADEACEAANKQIKEHRKRTKRRTAPSELSDELKRAREVRKAAKQHRNEVRALVYPQVKDELMAAAAAHEKAISASYRTAVEGGLYWATHGDVRARYKTAVKRLKEARKKGQHAELRFRRWDGTGTIAAQVRRPTTKKSSPPRSPEVLASNTNPWRSYFALKPGEFAPEAWGHTTNGGHRKGATAWIRIGSATSTEPTDEVVALPIVYHRPIPPDAEILMARLTRRRIGLSYKADLTVCVQLPDPPIRREGKLVVCHLGWRSLPDGALRVAMVYSETPPPPRLRDVVRGDGHIREIVIPRGWREEQESLEHLQSRRAKSFELTKKWLVEWLEQHPDLVASAKLPTPAEVRQWRSTGRLAVLAIQLRDETDPGLKEPAEALEAWRRQDKHLLNWQANERDQLVGRRDDAWRAVAAWLTRDAALVVVDDWDIAGLARVPDLAGDDNYAARAAQSNRRLAAPSILREKLRVTAARDGVLVTAPELDGAATHYGCGGELPADNRAGTVMVQCTRCGQMVDQDYNTIRHMQAAAAANDTARK